MCAAILVNHQSGPRLTLSTFTVGSPCLRLGDQFGLLLLAVQTGLRLSELTSLQHEDLAPKLLEAVSGR